MRNVVDWLYPAHDKITVFMMAFLMLTVLGFSAELRQPVWDAFNSWYAQEPFQAVFSGAAVAACFVAALTFPFSKHDLRGMAMVVVLLNVLAALAANVAIAVRSPTATERWVNWAFVLYFAGWLVVIRCRSEGQLIGARDPQPGEALFAGATCALLLVAAMEMLGASWLTAYSFAIATASSIHLAIRRLVLGPLASRL
jgi:hypothetical protein